MANCPATILKTGNTYQLIANVAPANAEDKSVIWRSSNNEVASVDENGLVSALSQGSVKITATTNDGGYSGNCNIGVMGTATGVEKFYNNNRIKMYPNPVTEKLYLEFLNEDEEREIVILNQIGQVIFKDSATGVQKTIDINHLNIKGILAVMIKSKGHCAVQKICVAE